MRKIFLTIGISVFMAMLTYVPFAGSLVQQNTHEVRAAEYGDACIYDQDCGQAGYCKKDSQYSQGICITGTGGGFGATCENSSQCSYTGGYECSTDGRVPRQCVRADGTRDPLENNPVGGGGGGVSPVGGSGSNGVPPVGGGGSNGVPPVGGGGAGTSGTCDSLTQFCNPLLSKYNTLCKVLEGILNLITQIGAIIAVILIIWVGFKFITAQGNDKKLTDAKKAFVTTIIGTAVLLGASAIAQIIVKTVFAITNKDNPGVCQL
jgi:hypothetical protein